jgi:cysteate synthase
MVKAWDKNSRELFPEDLNPKLIEQITTRVLSSRYPAYSIMGGVFDALNATGGKMYGVENNEVFAGMELFEETEGIDLVPAAGVAVAALRKAVENGHADKSDTILLNLTGGGEKRLKKDMKTYRVEPVFVSRKITDKEIEELLCKRLKVN